MIISSKRLSKISIVIVFLNLSFLSLVTAQEGSVVQNRSKNIKNTIILPPDNVLSAIKKICPNCKVVTVNELADEAREEFLEIHPNANPGWIIGDFNGDGLNDYAVLLYEKKKDKIYQKLLVLLAINENTFTRKTIVKEYEGDFYWYIGVMPAGKVIRHTMAFAPDKNTPNEVVLKYTAIEYYKAGSSMSVFYFMQGAFHVMPVSY